MLRPATAVLALVISSGFLLATPVAGQEARTHTVSRGETLWDLARSYYGNPFEWRRIYQANTDVVENPHWIYPGEVLTIPGIEAEGQVTQMDVSQPMPADMGLCPAPGARTVFYEGQRGTEACPPQAPANRTIFFDDPREAMGGGVVSAEERPWMAVPIDIFYSAHWLLDPEMEGAPPHLATITEFRREGSEISSRTTARPYERLRLEMDEEGRPDEGDLLQTFRLGRTIDAGQVVMPTGLLTVTELTDSGVVAVVSNEYARVQLGDMVRQAPPFDMEPGFGAEPVQGGPEGEILGFAQQSEVPNLGHVGFVNLGSADGIRLGDELQALAEEDEGWTDQVVATLQIVQVQENRASFRVVEIISPIIQAGTRVRVSGRLP